MHSQSRLHKHSIVTGAVDSYCLVCDCYLRSEDEAVTHTKKPIHKKNIGAIVYLEKYKEDQIMKVKRGYYCCYCNILISTTTKVGLHISDLKHQKNMGAHILSRVGDKIIAFNEVIISQTAWHGMSENTCNVCNAEFEDEAVHKNEEYHNLKLVQGRYEFGKGYVYRKVDNESFFCLICGRVYAINDRLTHHENMEHISFYNAAKALKDKIETNAQTTGKLIPKIAPPKQKTVNEHKEDVTVKVKKIDPEVAKSVNVPSAKKKEVTAPKTTDAATMPKTADAAQHTKLPEDKKTKEVDSKKTKVAAKSTKDSINDILRTEASAQNASKLINTNKDSNFQEHLAKNKYMVDCINNTSKCIVCDVDEIRKEDINMHVANDLHHQMMVKKHQKALNKKKVNKPTVQTNEASPPVALKAASPLDTQSKIDEKKPNCDIISDKERENSSNMLDSVDKFQKNDITIDFALDKAYCKRCKVDIKFDTASVERHIDEQHTNITISNTKKEEKDSKAKLESFAQNNYMEIIQNQAHCKACNVEMLLNIKDMTTHINLKSHKDKVISYKNKTETSTLVDVQIDTASVEKHIKNMSNTKKEEKDLKAILESFAQNDYMEIIQNQAHCKACNVEMLLHIKGMTAHVNLRSHKDKVISYKNKTETGTVADVKFDTVSVEKHIDEQHTNKAISDTNKKEEKDSQAKLESFAQTNYMEIILNQAHCKACNVEMLLNIKDMTAHVNLRSHKDKVISYKNKTGTDTVKKVPAIDFMHTFIRLESNLGSEVVVNDTYVLRYHSVHCVIVGEETMTCKLCDVAIAKENVDQLTQHLTTFSHKEKMGECNVVISLPQEFIREIAPEVYHCGYCNEIIKCWTEMAGHLNSASHAYAKRFADWNLKRCQIAIRNAKPIQVSSLNAVNLA